MKAYPIRDYIIVSKDEPAKQTSGGLYIPSAFDANVVTGTVLAVGGGKLLSDGTSASLEVSVGDKIMFSKPHATELKLNDQVSYLLREDHILCVLK